MTTSGTLELSEERSWVGQGAACNGTYHGNTMGKSWKHGGNGMNIMGISLEYVFLDGFWMVWWHLMVV